MEHCSTTCMVGDGALFGNGGVTPPRRRCICCGGRRPHRLWGTEPRRLLLTNVHGRGRAALQQWRCDGPPAVRPLPSGAMASVVLVWGALSILR